jgi:multidrug efflux pump subunit AcrB
MQLDMDMVRDYVKDNIKPRLSRLAGVADIQIAGGAEKQIQIHIDPRRLANEGLSPIDVRDAIRKRNRDFSSGKIESGKRRYFIRTVGRLNDIEQLGNLVLKRNQDEVVRLRDVAKIELDHQVVEEQAFINGQPVILLSIKRESGSNVIDIKNAVTREIAIINRDSLSGTGLQLHLTSDDVTYVKDSIDKVLKNLILGAALATLVMFLFLRSYRITALAVLGIPICTVAALLGLSVAGRSINVISLAGIAFSIGMTLDNSIVVLESILQQRAKGLPPIPAAISGVRAVWTSVFASTMTTVLVFVPIVFIVEEAGQLYSDVAISVSASIVASMLVAIVIVPVANAHLNLPPAGKFGAPLSRLEQWVLNSSSSVVSRKGRRWTCVCLTLLVGLVSVTLLMPPAEYLPEGEEPKVFARLSAPSGYSLETMKQVGDELNRYLMPFIDADVGDYKNRNTEFPAIRYVNMRITPERVNLVVEAKDPSQIDDLMSALLKKLKTYTEMKAFASKGSIISSNDGGTRSINLDISGSDLASLLRLAQDAHSRAQQVFVDPRIKSSPSSLLLSQPMIRVVPDWDRAEELGLSVEDIGFSVAALTDGAYVHEFYLKDDKIDMYMYNRSGPGSRLDALDSILLPTSTGVPIALSEFAKLVESVDASSVRRLNGQRTVTLHIIPPDNVALEDGVEIVRRDLVGYLNDQGLVPVDVNIVISGAADQLEAIKEVLLSNYALAALIVYLLMIAIFNHWGYPLLVMVTIPLGVAVTWPNGCDQPS